MAEDHRVEMDYEAHEGTYSLFTGLVKWGLISSLATGALVIFLIT